MAWSDVAAKILFWDSSAGQTWALTGPPVSDVDALEQFAILECLHRIYDGSANARNFLEMLAAGRDRMLGFHWRPLSAFRALLRVRTGFQFRQDDGCRT